MDPSTAAAIIGAAVALAVAVIVAAAVLARDRGGLVVTVRLWWGPRSGGKRGTPPGHDDQ